MLHSPLETEGRSAIYCGNSTLNVALCCRYAKSYICTLDSQGRWHTLSSIVLPEDQIGMCTQSGVAGNLSASEPGCDTNRCKVCIVTLIALIAPPEANPGQPWQKCTALACCIHLLR